MAMTDARLRSVARMLVNRNPDLVACGSAAESSKKEKDEAMEEGRGSVRFWDSLVARSRGELLSAVDNVVTMYSASDAPPDFSGEDFQKLSMYTTLEARKRGRK